MDFFTKCATVAFSVVPRISAGDAENWNSLWVRYGLLFWQSLALYAVVFHLDLPSTHCMTCWKWSSYKHRVCPEERMDGRTNTMFIGRSLSTGHACNVLKVNLSEWKNSIRCQTYVKTEDHSELKLYFNSRHSQHWLSAQRKMQQLRISWRNLCIWRLDFCQIIKSCSCFWMDHKSKQVYSFIDRFRSIYDIRR